jgi:hypothetical protein
MWNKPFKRIIYTICDAKCRTNHGREQSTVSVDGKQYQPWIRIKYSNCGTGCRTNQGKE